MHVNKLWQVSLSKAFYKVATELREAAQLYVFIWGTLYLNLGVLKHVFRVRCAVYVLVTGTEQRFFTVMKLLCSLSKISVPDT